MHVEETEETWQVVAFAVTIEEERFLKQRLSLPRAVEVRLCWFRLQSWKAGFIFLKSFLSRFVVKSALHTLGSGQPIGGYLRSRARFVSFRLFNLTKGRFSMAVRGGYRAALD